jgi:hypothetical protein
MQTANYDRPSNTARLSHMLGRVLRAPVTPTRAAPMPSVTGWDEMQGYPPGGAYGYDPYAMPTVGALSWGDVGHGLNLMVNPVAQYHALQNAWRGPQQAPAPPPRPMVPPGYGPPMLPPGAVQAYTNGPRKLLSYMGLGSLSWESTDTLTEKLMTANPQAAFRGRRLVISQAKSSGATGILVTITDALTVSGMPQTPAPNQPAPVEMFDAATTYSMLDLQIATTATEITIGITVSAIPASGETVAVSAGLYGEWLR